MIVWRTFTGGGEVFHLCDQYKSTTQLEDRFEPMCGGEVPDEIVIRPDGRMYCRQCLRAETWQRRSRGRK